MKRLLAIVILLALVALSPITTQAQDTSNKAVMERFVLEVVPADGNVDQLDEMCAEDFVFHFFTGEDMDYEAYKAFWEGNHASLPDLNVTDHVIIQEGDMVAAWWYMGGTFENEWAGIPPTGEPIGINVFAVWRFEDGKLVEAWDMLDTLGFMRQLGAVPSETSVGPETPWVVEYGASDMSIVDQQMLAIRHAEEANAGNFAGYNAIFAEDLVAHRAGVAMDLPGLMAFEQAISDMMGGFTIDYHQPMIVSEGNLVIAMYHIKGEFSAEFQGIPPNGNPIDIVAVKMWRFADGKAVEHWTAVDMLSMMGQMTAEPAS